MPTPSPTVHLLHAARRQLEQISEDPCIAWLLGWRSAERVEILNVCRFLAEDGQILKTTATPFSLQDELHALERHFPCGLVPLGCATVFRETVPMSVFAVKNSLSILSAKAVALQSDVPSSTVSISGIWVMGQLTVFVNGVGCSFEDISASQSVHLSSSTAFRYTLEAAVPVYYEENGSVADLWTQLGPIVDSVESAAAHLIVDKCDPPVEMLLRSESIREVISDDCCRTVSGSTVACSLLIGAESALQCPSLQLQMPKNAQTRVRGLQLGITVPFSVPKSTPMSRIKRQYLAPALRKALHQLCAFFEQDTAMEQVSMLQFDVEHYVVPVSVFYPFLPGTNSDESSQLEQRRQLHRRFLQKEDRPIFLSRCARDSPRATLSDVLINIHEKLPLQRRALCAAIRGCEVCVLGFPEGGMVATVSGSYQYCHYGHDDFNDAGWGCAYRSLQTVFSWKIQEVLVEMGDKQASFYGSREWIGSIEVGTVLEEMLGVTYHVISKAAHQDISAIARELVHHFRTQGTPISIGGGVLAYTLLGIYFNDQSAEVELLILDPHYTGKDTVEAILKGGWVAWKKPTDKAAAGGPLFVKNTHYNFMCTQRPNIV